MIQPGSTLYWLLQEPKEQEFQEFPAKLLAWVERKIEGLPSFHLEIDATGAIGSFWAIGGIALRTREGVELPWKAPLEQGALETFGVKRLADLKGLPCLICLWHCRSVAVRNPVTRALFWPERISEAFSESDVSENQKPERKPYAKEAR